MRLQDYLSRHSMTPADFAEQLGQVTEYGVRKWVTGERIPRRKAMERIVRVTGGQVSAADFFASAENAA